MICFGFPSETGLPFLHHYTTQIQFILPPENCTLHKQLYKTYDWNATDKRLNQMFVYIELIFRHMFLFQLIKLGREKKKWQQFRWLQPFCFCFHRISRVPLFGQITNCPFRIRKLQKEFTVAALNRNITQMNRPSHYYYWYFLFVSSSPFDKSLRATPPIGFLGGQFSGVSPHISSKAERKSRKSSIGNFYHETVIVVRSAARWGVILVLIFVSVFEFELKHFQTFSKLIKYVKI